MYSAKLTLTRAWIVLAANPTNSPISCGTVRPQQSTEILDGEIRAFAGNRQQSVSRETQSATYPVMFRALTAAQYQQILDWRGQTILFRSIDGDRIFGTYFSVQKTRHIWASAGPVYDAAVTLGLVTYNESV